MIDLTNTDGISSMAITVSLPTVRNTDGFKTEWDRTKIINMIVKETKLCEIFYSKPAATREEAEAIAKETESIVLKMRRDFLSGPLIREIVNTVLIDRGHTDWRNCMTRVGVSVHDAFQIDSGYGFEAKDNANQLDNAETSHKRKADKLSKEQNLLLIPSEVSELHLNGDLHCVSGDMPFIYKVGGEVYITEISKFVETYVNDGYTDYYVPSFDVVEFKPSWKRVTRAIKNSPTELYKVGFTKGRQIVCTKDHPFYKTSGNTILKSPRELNDLKIGDRIATLDCIQSQENVETWYGNLVGFFLGDGSVAGNKICFHLKRLDKIEYLENVLKELGIDYNLREYENETVNVTFYENHLLHIWKNGKKMEHFSESMATGILAGLINSDGHIRTHGKNDIPYLEFDNVNKNIFDLYCVLLLMHGVSPSFQEYKCKRSVCSGKHVTHMLSKMRLRDKYMNIVNGKYEYGSKNKKCWSQLTIKSIEYDRTDVTYDITVEDNHNFLVGNGFVLTGNCHDLEYFGTRPFCFAGDTKLKIKNSVTGNTFTISIEEAFDTIDTLCVDQTELMDLCVLTPVGWKPIGKITRRRLDTNEYMLNIKTRRDRVIHVTPEHRIPVVSGPDRALVIKKASELTVGERLKIRVPGFNVRDRITSIKKSVYRGYVYDLFIDGDETEESHMFYLDNGLLVHNCQDWDLRYFLYYGLMPDGVGKQSSIAGPAKKAEVAFLHAVKAMGSAQTNFAGGQGFYNFLTFMAPYLVGKSEDEIEQLMQMFVYEMMQMMCARGGQSLVYEEYIVIRRHGIVSRIQIGELCSQYTVCIGNKEVSDGTEILSLNKNTHTVEWKPLTAVHRHVPASKIVKTTLKDGRSIVTTSDHSLFTLTNDGNVEEISPASRPDKIITAYFTGWESSIINSGIAMSDVAHIKEVSTPEYVYDVSVQDNENFVLANGIVAHNTVFSSVQLSPGVPKLWKDKPVVAKGHVYDGVRYKHKCTYGELEREVRLAFKALMAVMLKGDYEGKPFFFPKPEISLEPCFMEEDELFNALNPDVPTYKELYRMSFELAAKYGTPYFDNQLPVYRNANEGISCYQCCAYQFGASPSSDSEFNQKLYFEGGKHFSMGSWMVMSLNCPRAAYKAEHDDEALFKELKSLMCSAITVFKTKREWMERLIAANRIPFASQRPKDPNTGIPGEIAVDFDALVYTIGIIGINEMVQYHTGYQIHESDEAYKLAIRAMLEMKLYAKELSQKYNMEIALARTPAETTAQRFAVSDLMHEEYRAKAMQVIKGDVKQALEHISETKDLPVYYTNGTHFAPNASVTITERIQKEQIFFPIVDGGNIMHIWMGEKVPNPDGLMDFGMRIAKNTQVGYFAFTRDMTICLDEGYMSNGLQEKCPKCGSDNVQHLSRITGYLQNVEGWNAGKKQELKDRARYDI